MKIGIVCYPTLGGSGILATELGQELAKRGHEIHFIAYDVPFRLQGEEKNVFFHEVEISQYELFKYPDYTLTLSVEMAAVAKRHQLDLLHVHYAIPHATSAFLAKQLLNHQKVAVITTLHGTDITLVGKDPAYFEIVKFSIEQSDGVTAVSNSLKCQTCCHFGIEKPVEVIYNFFIPRPELNNAKPMRHLFVEEGQKLLLHSSNYRAVKRPEDVVHIFKRVRQKVPSRLLFLGSGGEIESVRNLVDVEGLSKEVIFLGKSREVDPYVASADLFLLPSAQESFGLAALEAMAYGVPVIASNVGGLPELVEQEKTGYLSPIGAIDEMSENAIRLLKDEKLYQAVSQAATERAKNHFSVEKIVPLYEDYYKKIVGHASS
jgi:L-malate glycosyltransferase